MLTALALVTALAFAQANPDYDVTVTTSVIAGRNAEQLNSWKLGVPARSFRMTTCEQKLSKKEMGCTYKSRYYKPFAVRIDLIDLQKGKITISNNLLASQITRGKKCKKTEARINMWKLCPFMDKGHSRSFYFSASHNKDDQTKRRDKFGSDSLEGTSPEDKSWIDDYKNYGKLTYLLLSPQQNKLENFNENNEMLSKSFPLASGPGSSEVNSWRDIYKNSKNLPDGIVLSQGPDSLQNNKLEDLYNNNGKSGLLLSYSPSSSDENLWRDVYKNNAELPDVLLLSQDPDSLENNKFEDLYKLYENNEKNGLLLSSGSSSTDENTLRDVYINREKLPVALSQSLDLLQNNKFEDLYKLYKNYENNGLLLDSGPSLSDENSWRDVYKNHEKLPDGFVLSIGPNSSQKNKYENTKDGSLADIYEYFINQKLDDYIPSLSNRGNPSKDRSWRDVYLSGYLNPNDLLLRSFLYRIATSFKNQTEEEPANLDLQWAFL